MRASVLVIAACAGSQAPIVEPLHNRVELGVTDEPVDTECLGDTIRESACGTVAEGDDECAPYGAALEWIDFNYLPVLGQLEDKQPVDSEQRARLDSLVFDPVGTQAYQDSRIADRHVPADQVGAWCCYWRCAPTEPAQIESP